MMMVVVALAGELCEPTVPVVLAEGVSFETTATTAAAGWLGATAT